MTRRLPSSQLSPTGYVEPYEAGIEPDFDREGLCEHLRAHRDTSPDWIGLGNGASWRRAHRAAE